MRITLNVDGTELVGNLTEGTAARDLATLLPLTLTLNDFHATERIGQLPRPLNTVDH